MGGCPTHPSRGKGPGVAAGGLRRETETVLSSGHGNRRRDTQKRRKGYSWKRELLEPCRGKGYQQPRPKCGHWTFIQGLEWQALESLPVVLSKLIWQQRVALSRGRKPLLMWL